MKSIRLSSFSFLKKKKNNSESKEKTSGIASRYLFSVRAIERAQGQVSIEILTSGILLMFLFLVVLLVLHQSNQAQERFQQNVQEEEICVKVSSIITYMNSNPPYTETIIEVPADINIVSNAIFVGDIFCPFLGNTANVQLNAGLVKAFDLNGLVVFTNDLNYDPFNPPVSLPPSGSNISGAVLLLIDDQGQQWTAEVQADDVSYAVSTDDQTVDPDWVEFRFSNLGLTSTAALQDVRVLIKHLENNLSGLTPDRRRVQCWNGSVWVDVEAYEADFVETLYLSPNLNTCVTDLNLANNARIRMTYEPNGIGSAISIDYGRIDVNYLFSGTIIDLWENTNDLPQPVDFRTDINSIANTFGPAAGNDGWDWQTNVYGGSLSATGFNVDPNLDGNVSDSNVFRNQRIEIRIGGKITGAPADPDDNASIGPVASGAYGIQIDINNDTWAAIQGGALATLSFVYTVDADATWGNGVDSGEEGWVKARFGNASLMNYLGSNLDAADPDADATAEIWWSDSPTDYYGFFTQDISSLITGAGDYYIDFGTALSDWDSANEGMGVYFDNINLVVA